MRALSLLPAFAAMLLLCGAAFAGPDGIAPSDLAPGLIQARDAISRLERLTEEAEAIGVALFRLHNQFGEKRATAPAQTGCRTAWLVDLGFRTREFGRAFRDSVQGARMQAGRVEDLTVQQTVQPLLDPETTHKVATLLTRVDDLVRRYPESAAWQDKYVEPLMKGCASILMPAAGIGDPVAAVTAPGEAPALPGARKGPMVAVLAFGGGFLCPGAVPAAGVMLVAGEICYSATENCDCVAATVSPATVLGPETKAGSAN